MLLTGFDVPHLQVLYLDRGPKEHELLQAIARVNRTHEGKSHGLVVDYFGVARHLQEALAAYSSEDVAGVMASLKDELPRLEDRHRRVVGLFLDLGAGLDRPEQCVDLLRDVKLRARFTAELKLFLDSLDIVLPRPEALPYVGDARILGWINKVAANRYRDDQLNIAGLGGKVRELVDRHLVSSGIDPRIPPISILDARFDEEVERHEKPRTRASQMEHALRHHIRERFNEDPARYRKLSERLEAILRDLHDNWEALVAALGEILDEVRHDRQENDAGLDPRTQAPFLHLLKEEVHGDAPISPEELQDLARHTVRIVEHLRQELRTVDFWRKHQAQLVLRQWLVEYLDDDVVTLPFARCEAVADRLMELAQARRDWLAG
jgi:type I restriction enzyme R subunit